MSQESEQRQDERVPADYPVEFRVPGSPTAGVGRIRDLSASGVQFLAEEKLEPGTDLSIRIPPTGAGRPPLINLAFVVRCSPAQDEDGYTIACTFD